ncbi:MAG TPA: hypothetical protein VK927_05515, partial [Adhaeribacter sp.]|nr:hypothetical protein [Adhaeribacter sp.]
MRNIFLSSILVATLASCSTTNYTYRSNDINTSNVIASDVVVDLKVDLEKKIETTSNKQKTVELAKTEAYYKALKENKVDVVVDPIFEITTTDKFLIFGGKNVVKLTGFGAYYFNPRTKLEAIRELKSIDTSDIKNFNSIFMGQHFLGDQVISGSL